jgi:outer membrane protein assembly factor BamB
MSSAGIQPSLPEQPSPSDRGIQTSLPQQPPSFPAPPAAESPKRLRLGLPLGAAAAYWVLAVVIGHIEKFYFFGFIYNMASAAVLALVFLLWWVANRRIGLSGHLAGIFLVVGVGAAVEPLCHASVGIFGLLVTGLPVVLTAVALGLLAARVLPFAWRGPCAAVVVVAAWGFLPLLRIDGLDSSLRPDIHWRWTPSAEDLFLKGRMAGAAAPQAASASWKPSVGPNDWTGFRGPQRDGVLRGVRIATDWQTTPPRLLWRQRVGPAWSSLVVLDGRLFTQEQRGEREAVVCCDAATGQLLWSHEDPARFSESASGVGPRATPTFADGRLYTLGATGRLNCLDAATGRRLWSRDVAAEAEVKPPQWGFCSSPLVIDGKVIVYAGGAGGKGLLAYRADSGEPLWSAPAGGSSYSSPQRTVLDGKPQVLMLYDGGLIGVDLDTGSVLWSTGKAMPGAPRTIQPHALGGNTLLVGTLEGFGVARIEVTRGSEQWQIEQPWNSMGLRPEFPDLVVHDGHAYGFDQSTFCCIDTATGERRWREGRYGRGQVILLAEQALLLVLSETGQAVLLEADPQRQRELGRFQALTGKTWNHPVIAHGRLYVRNAEEMACYELKPAKSDR